ncbi:MAG: SH3 domain-containing protein [Eubacterium sp.]|nr:SH3 domain-containing protein [Eubacterium sp.]MCI8919118.1 SH3 domain-containing protein [Eubacterium sp.]
MKRRFVKLGALFCTFMMTIMGSSRAAFGAAVQAGISATLSGYVYESANAKITEKKNEKNNVQVSKNSRTVKKLKSADSSRSIKSVSKKEEDGTICGYTNLGIANVDNYLNVRSEPGESAKIVGKLPSDAGCEILDAKDGWYHIRSGKVSGYVRSDYIITGEKARKLAEELKKTVATVNTVTVYIREKPNTDCTILTIVTEDEELEVVKEGDEWIEVKLDDENGFVSAQYVDLSEELKKAMVFTETSQQSGVSDRKYSLVQTALSYVGNRYVWGGTSLTNGVDCSGFTMQIMAKYGISLPHSSRGQAGYGRSVSTSELQPGDLIFYGSGGTISHVAIYIGNGQIVHASNSRDGIKVSNAFYRTPICCRRMF